MHDELAKDDDARTAIDWAAALGLELPAECLPGVIENLRLLAEHAARLDA